MVIIGLRRVSSESSSSSTTRLSGRISWNWGNILNSTDLESISSKSSDGGLGTWSGGLGVNTTSSSKFDVNSSDTNILEGFADILTGKHRSMWRRFFSIGEISDVDESVVEGSKEMDNTEDSGVFLLGLWWTEVGLLLFLNFNFSFLWWHFKK